MVWPRVKLTCPWFSTNLEVMDHSQTFNWKKRMTYCLNINPPIPEGKNYEDLKTELQYLSLSIPYFSTIGSCVKTLFLDINPKMFPLRIPEKKPEFIKSFYLLHVYCSFLNHANPNEMPLLNEIHLSVFEFHSTQANIILHKTYMKFCHSLRNYAKLPKLHLSTYELSLSAIQSTGILNFAKTWSFNYNKRMDAGNLPKLQKMKHLESLSLQLQSSLNGYYNVNYVDGENLSLLVTHYEDLICSNLTFLDFGNVTEWPLNGYQWFPRTVKELCCQSEFLVPIIPRLNVEKEIFDNVCKLSIFMADRRYKITGGIRLGEERPTWTLPFFNLQDVRICHISEYYIGGFIYYVSQTKPDLMKILELLKQNSLKSFAIDIPTRGFVSTYWPQLLKGLKTLDIASHAFNLDRRPVNPSLVNKVLTERPDNLERICVSCYKEKAISYALLRKIANTASCPSLKHIVAVGNYRGASLQSNYFSGFTESRFSINDFCFPANSNCAYSDGFKKGPSMNAFLIDIGVLRGLLRVKKKR